MPMIFNSLIVYKLVETSVDDELGRSVSTEIYLFVMTFTFMCLFCCTVLGRYQPGATCSCVKQRWAVGLAGCSLVFASMGAGYGFASSTGAMFTQLQMVLPFILLGIGVDDMLIIAFALDNVKKTHPNADIPELLAITMRKVGMSITLTSLTAAMAFALGSMSALPAITYFCVYACFSILTDYILQAARTYKHTLTVHTNTTRTHAHAHTLTVSAPPQCGTG